VQAPYATCKLRRERQPLCYRTTTNSWILTRYQDTHAMLRDPRFGRDQVPFYEAVHGEGANDQRADLTSFAKPAGGGAKAASGCPFHHGGH